ncbi:MAG: hypothetical protein KDC83_14415 [Flavobacteriales bacterium]|nr:hypothetical protein [Flavobacteriales bacterium]
MMLPYVGLASNPFSFIDIQIFQAGYIERLGTGTSDMVSGANQAGLVDPVFLQEDTFNVTIYRNGYGATDQVPTKHRPSSDEVPQEYRSSSVEVKNLVKVLHGEMSRRDMQKALQLKHEGNFRENYLEPALAKELVEMKYPDSPNHPKQRYLLTDKGQELLNSL